MSDNANAYRLAFFTAVIYATALTIGMSQLFYLTYVLAGVLAVAFLWTQINSRGVVIRRTVNPPQAQVGQIVEETIEVQNNWWLPKLFLELRDHSTLQGHHFAAVVSLPSKGTRTWSVRTLCGHRGLYRLGPTAVQTGDPFGLFNASRLYTESSELLVLPPTLPLSSLGLPPSDLPGGNRVARRAYHSTPNAAGIREYLPGDPMNRIHWPITARLQKMMVKEFELDPTSDIWIVLDLEAEAHVPFEGEDGVTRPSSWGDAHGQLSLEPSTEEYAVACAASMAAHFTSQGRTVGLVAWGQHRVTLPADRGGRQLVKVLRALAVLRAEGSTPLHEVLAAEHRLFARQDTVVTITPSLSEQWVSDLQTLVYSGTRAMAVLVEPGTFGGEGNPMMLVSALASINVPVHLVKRDVALDVSLGQSVLGLGRRNLG